jgi:hypothetical protein
VGSVITSASRCYRPSDKTRFDCSLPRQNLGLRTQRCLGVVSHDTTVILLVCVWNSRSLELCTFAHVVEYAVIGFGTNRSHRFV